MVTIVRDHQKVDKRQRKQHTIIEMTYSSWFFDKIDFKQTPSISDGLSFEDEARYRREGARFINKVGTRMNLRYDTMATGVAYFHRFYMCHSFKQFPRFVTACCCLFLAGKVEETPKKCKDIIKTAKCFLTDAQFAKFGEDPKEEVLTLERILLQTINFDLQVDHPYEYLLKYAKVLKGDKDMLQKLVQMAWTFINDSMCTTISLQWEPEVIAIALMFLAGKLTKFEVIDWEGRTKGHQKWWDMFVVDISTDLLEDICHQVLDLYSMPQDSPLNSPTTQQQQSTTFDPQLPNQTNSTNLVHPNAIMSTHLPNPNILMPPQAAIVQQTPTLPPANLVPPIPPNFKPPPILPIHVANPPPNVTGPPMPINTPLAGIPPPFFRPTGPPILPPPTTGPPFQNM